MYTPGIRSDDDLVVSSREVHLTRNEKCFLTSLIRDYQQDVIESESSEYESDYEDFLFDFVYGDPDAASLKSYGDLSSDFVLCPKKAEIRDCCCHWPKSARKRSIILTRFYIFCAFWRLGMEVSFFYLQQKYYIGPVPDVFECEMRGYHESKLY